jgi:EAL domain-containing protein (putative c-di-GMP-specific phosphodiesterase class I)/GGDEF domain-containing protein/DNA-binding NarL/FixJ family response regulator
MTAQQPPHAPVRLLIAESSENAAHRFDSLLRDAGIATRPEIVDLPMALQSVSEVDMMLCSAALPELARVLPILRDKAPHVPIIIVNNESTSLTPTDVLELGAADVVADSEPRHLVLVVKRELEHVCQHVRLHQTRRALEEAEQRCQLLLQGSKAAIAYVHEGMHIYANEVYLKLFGFNDADDLLGLPLIDLLNAGSTNTLKAAMKKFRQNEQEIEFSFAGNSTDGDAVSGSMTLASAEYEGEHCLQITVRTAEESREVGLMASGSATADSAGAGAVAQEDDIPTLTDSAAANGNAEEFELEFDTSDIDSEGADTNDASGLNTDASELGAASEVKEDAVEPIEVELNEQPAIDETPADVATLTDTDISDSAVEEPAPVADSAATGHTTNNLGEFLTAAESYCGEDSGFRSIFVAQVDDYSGLQQTYGLAGKDKICREVQSLLAAKAQSPNMPISAYQWAVVIKGENRDQVLDLVNGYRQTVEDLLLEVREKTVRPTVSFGGAELDMTGCDSLQTAMESALDRAFSTVQESAAESEGNQIELPALATDDEMDDEATRVLLLINEAIESQKFVLLFQPIISLRGDSDEHYEVFLRMLDRNGEQMAPNEFLRTAIEKGVAGKIDRWVILQSIKMLSTHRSKGHNTRLTINVTSNSVADPEFSQWLGVAIKAARLPSDAVIFQITERDASTYIRQTREFVEALKGMHCRSSLSRFGLASEPFEILRHIPADFVKLDGSHIEALADDPDLKDEITGMIQKLQGDGKLTIVPMVESANVLSALWQAGANYIQGHYLQQPSTSMDYDFSTDD